MRLIITTCPSCSKVTDAKHADTLEDLEQIGEFIRLKKLAKKRLSILEYGPNSPPIKWCYCTEQFNERQIES